MGSALGATLVRSGHRVVATLEGRSPRTAALSARTEFEFLPDLRAVVAASDVVLSVVPPGSAVAVAQSIAEAVGEGGRPPLVVDMNAVSPASVDRVAAILGAAGVALVDGSISGPPPWEAGSTHVYLSGPRAAEVVSLGFDGVDAQVVGAELGAASALKMCTASVYKGTALILAHALVTAQAYGVLDDARDDLAESFPELLDGVAPFLAMSASKAHRYIAEMQEIAATQSTVGLTPAVFAGIAAAYEAIAASPAGGATPEDAAGAERLEDVLAAIAPRRQPT